MFIYFGCGKKEVIIILIRARILESVYINCDNGIGV